MSQDGTPQDPPYDDELDELDELAALQEGGLLTPTREAELRARLVTDPALQEQYGRLEQVRASLGDLDDDPFPAQYAERLDAALAAEAASRPDDADRMEPTPATGALEPSGVPAGEVVDLGAVRARRRRFGALGAVAAALVVVAVVGGAVLGGGAGSPQPRPPDPGSALALGARDLASACPQITQSRDLGALAAPGALQTCLAAGPTGAGAGLSSVLGARPVVVDGRPGELVAVAQEPRVALIAFDPSCQRYGAPDPIIAQTVITP